MIIEYDASGRITHVINDPVPLQMHAFLVGTGARFLNLPPTPWPAEPQFDEDGAPLLDESGNQVLASNGMDSAAVDILADHVVDGELRRRPDCPAVVTVTGRTVHFAGLPGGTAVVVEIDGVRLPIEDTMIEIDEPGPLAIVITPPWPYLEARHDVEIE